MVAPIDYSLDVQAPFQSALQGFQGASAIRGTLLQQDAQAAQQASQDAMRKDLASLSANPTPQAVAQMSLRYPQLSEQFKRSFDMLGEEQKQARLSSTIPVYAAIQSGRPDIAAGRLRETATAQENSGQKDEAARTRAMADLIEQHPEAGATTAGLLLSSVMGPEKFAETFGKLGAESRAAAEAPSDLAKKREDAKKAKYDAEIAAVKAQFAGSDAIADLERKGWDIKKIAADIDIAKQNSRISAMNAQTSRMNSDLQRQELALKIEEATAKRDNTIREKVATAEAGANSIDNMLNTIERVKKNPALNAVLGSIEGGRFYPQRIAGAIDVVGISNFNTFLKNTESYRRDLRRVEYGDERDPKMRALLQRISPLSSADKIRKPLFVVQGKNDPRVPAGEAEQIVDTLKRSNTPVWYLLAKDEGHGFAKKKNADFQFYATVLFIKKYLLK